MTRKAATLRALAPVTLGIAFSLAASAQTAGEPPAIAAAPAQPATPAVPVAPAATVRNALAPQAAAASIEACTNKAENLLAALDKGDFAGAEMDFNPAMRAGLPPEQLKQAWQSLPTKFGQPGPRGAPQNSRSDGYAVIKVPMPFQNGDLAAQVACGTDGKIAGFHVMTAPSAPATPAAPMSPSSSG